MKKNIIYVLVILVLITNIISAQIKTEYQTISIPEGLSSPNVTYVYQDRFGYIWISTEDGLNRYDGTKIKIYRNDPDDPNSLYSNSVYSIVEDHEGYLWIGSIGVVNRYNYSTQKFDKVLLNPTLPQDKSNRVISLSADSRGRIWASSFGGVAYLLSKKLNEFEGLYFNNESDDTGLSEIWDITELKNGKILIADFKKGIFQYDETSGKLFKFFLSNNFSPDNIIKIQEDDDGLIWFSGMNKVISYNPNFYTYNILKGFNIPDPSYNVGFQKINDENYVFVSEPTGLLKFNPKTSEIVETINTRFTPYIFTTDKFGIMWIAAQGGVIKYDPNKVPFTHTQFNIAENQNDRNDLINYIELDKSDNKYVWLLSSNNSLIKYNLDDGNNNIFQIPSQIANAQIEFDNFAQDNFGNLLLGSSSQSGIYKFNPESNKLSELKELSNIFSDNYNVRDFAFDQNNSMFIASTIGLIYHNYKTNSHYLLPTYTTRRYNKGTEKEIKNVLQDSEELAMIIKADESKSYNIDFSLKEDSYVLIRCLGEGRIDDLSGNLMWDYGIISRKNGDILFEMKDFNKTFNAGGGAKNRKQYETMRLEKGDYNLKYIMDQGHSYDHFNAPPPFDSTLYGIQIYKINETANQTLEKLLTQELNNSKILPLGNISDIEISRKYSNSVYLSSDSQGLFKYNRQDSSFTHFTFGEINSTNQKNWLKYCYEDITGNLWISSAQGLVWLNPENGKWRVFTEKDGLPSNNILNTIEDKDGNLWIISLGGLSKFNKNDPAEKWNFVNYDTRDGLTGYSFNGNLVKTPTGEVLFIVGDVLHRFTPGKSNKIKPDIIINDLKISDQSIFDSDSPFKLETSLMETKVIELPYNLNDLSFSFDIIHYSRPYKNRLFYKLEGFNEMWVESELGSASFTNLDPGNYEFKVRGISADGIRNDEGASIIIVISPPWWKTTYAYISYSLLFALLIFSIDRIQRRRILTKERNATAIREAELKLKFAEAENERKTKELEEARELQLSMLPRELPNLPNLDIAVYMKTATEVGGDYYDFHVGIDGALTVVVGDATGHGMKAGTMVTTTKSLFNVLAPNPNIIETFHEMTRCLKLMQMEKLSMCMTMLKIMGNKIQMSSAGMPPILIYKRDSQSIEEHVLKGMPLGTFNNFPYSLVESSISTGDTILLMSDGFPELLNENKEMYGYKRARNYFEEITGETPEEIIRKLKESGSEWVNDNDPDDDVTFVVIKVK